MDKIRLSGLQVYAHHGVYPEETALGQRFVVNAELYGDTRPAGMADDLSLSTNYGEAALFLTDYLQKNTFQLIEAAAEQTARALLLRFPLVRGVKLELCKPQAPIPLPFENVSVEITRNWHTAFIALGSNLGDKSTYIQEAVEKLKQNPDIRVKQVSSIIETEPYGGVEQDQFLNGVLEAETLLTPQELLDALHVLEQEAHRERLIHWGPRTLDLDIIAYDDEVIHTADLTIPHVDMQNREFVLAPLAEICPFWFHPLLKKTAAQLLAELREKAQ